jgi:hypothetical protein
VAAVVAQQQLNPLLANSFGTSSPSKFWNSPQLKALGMLLFVFV